MTARKKRGTGLFISMVAFMIGGILCFATESTPTWFPTVLEIVGLVAGFLGFKTVFPDTD